ncbi:hypothetical protein BURK2_02469 [Burkholderiales bacterium]|nr:MAG: divergent PAP2 family protein [Burkholderiales bacterium]CAG0992454.1 hypothetical protein BURK2_02469 [Burkholderiales bacterium]
MDASYLLTPLLAWLLAGASKFVINSLRARRLAFDLIGYGGLPSNHSAIVSSMAALIALREGIGHPAFGVALTLAFIVVLDARSLRREVGRHAEALNRIAAAPPQDKRLRERIGHTPVEIGAGVVVGVIVATLVHTFAR